MLPKLGFSLEMEYDRPIGQVIALLKAAGFSAVSPVWGQDLEEIAGCARACGMTVQSLHAPPKGMAKLWEPDAPDSAPLQHAMLESLEACARFEIPILVVHGWQGHGYVFPDTPLDFRFWDRLVSRARALGVCIAFENLEGEEYLAALMARYRDQAHVVFCWDSGHEMCYNYSEDMLAMFGDRLIMTHLNDNLGISRFDGKTFWTDDLHLLPYDGIADWDYNVQRLKKAQPMPILNFELGINSKPNRHENDLYGKMTLEEYFTEAYKRACKIAYHYSKA